MKQESVGSFAPSDALVMLRSRIRASNSFNFMSGGFVTYNADCRWTAVPGELPGTPPTPAPPAGKEAPSQAKGLAGQIESAK